MFTLSILFRHYIIKEIQLFHLISKLIWRSRDNSIVPWNPGMQIVSVILWTMNLEIKMHWLIDWLIEMIFHSVLVEKKGYDSVRGVYWKDVVSSVMKDGAWPAIQTWAEKGLALQAWKEATKTETFCLQFSSDVQLKERLGGDFLGRIGEYSVFIAGVRKSRGWV